MIEQLGPYRIVRVLGRGGMGTVYEGIHDETGQLAAIKALPSVLADDGNFRDRFMGEIETLKQLKHPNIVELYGDGEQDGLLFYAMELVVGHTLQEELQAKHEFRWPEVLSIGVDICRALQHAHAHGIIHRDLKPANLLRTQDRQIKLLDFGIAKLFGASHLTADGSVVGTADYMSPEQAEGRPVSNRTDLFSLGAVMFTLLARRPPFSGGSIPEVLHRLRYEAAPHVRRYAASVPLELDEIIDQLLQKDPQDRIPTALVLSNRLRAMEHGLSAKTMVEHPTLTDQPPQVSPNEQATRASSVKAMPVTEISPTSVEPDIENVPADAYSWNDATVVTSDEQAAKAPAAPASSETVADPPSSQNRFTPLDQQLRQQDQPPGVGKQDFARIAGMVAALVVLLGFVLWGVWTRSQPDTMYEDIAAQARAGELSGLEDEMEAFLTSHPDDARRAEVQDWLLDLHCQYLFSRLRILSTTQTPTDLQRAYIDAMKLVKAEPETALVRFEELLSNFADSPDEANPITCVQAAEHQVKRLRERQAAGGSPSASPPD